MTPGFPRFAAVPATGSSTSNPGTRWFHCGVQLPGDGCDSFNTRSKHVYKAASPRALSFLVARILLSRTPATHLSYIQLLSQRLTQNGDHGYKVHSRGPPLCPTSLGRCAKRVRDSRALLRYVNTALSPHFHVQLAGLCSDDLTVDHSQFPHIPSSCTHGAPRSRFLTSRPATRRRYSLSRRTRSRRGYQIVSSCSSRAARRATPTCWLRTPRNQMPSTYLCRPMFPLWLRRDNSSRVASRADSVMRPPGLGRSRSSAARYPTSRPPSSTTTQ